MRIRLLCLLLCLLLACAGCAARNGAPRTDRIQEYYAGLPGFTVDARLRTDFGDRIIDFSVRYTCRAEGEGELEVLAPEMIRGIRAKVSPGDVTLLYDGLVLELGALPGTGLSPMESLPLMAREWSRGYLVTQSQGKQEGLVTRDYRGARDGAAYEVTTVFDAGTMAPVNAELYIGGVCVVTAAFEGFEAIPQ